MLRTGKCFGIAAMLSLSACLHGPEKTTVEGTPPPRRVNQCAGECLELKPPPDADRVAMLRKAEELLSAQRHASMERMFARHLDVAIEILRQRDCKRPPTEAETALARHVDACLGHPADDGWTARMQGQGRGGLERAEDTLAKAQVYASKQEWKPASDLLRKNQTLLALYPFHAVQAGLTLAEAQRRLGQTEAAGQSWQQAVLMASHFSARWHAPALWEQLASQRPVSVHWPAPMATAFAARLPAPLQNLSGNPQFATEALVWFHIGSARLERSEASLALTAFKNADSHGAFPIWDELLTLHQAKALLVLQQAPAAASLLTTLTSRPSDCPWRSPALAILGSGKLQQGHTQQALSFLREAIETTSHDFLFRADAEANLGLTFLAMGDQPNGLRRLHEAQRHFEMTQDGDGLRQCLENEASYLAQLNKIDEANQVRLKMRELEAQNTR